VAGGLFQLTFIIPFTVFLGYWLNRESVYYVLISRFSIRLLGFERLLHILRQVLEEILPSRSEILTEILSELVVVDVEALEKLAVERVALFTEREIPPKVCLTSFFTKEILKALAQQMLWVEVLKRI
jgi:hypothetical protein